LAAGSSLYKKHVLKNWFVYVILSKTTKLIWDEFVCLVYPCLPGSTVTIIGAYFTNQILEQKRHHSVCHLCFTTNIWLYFFSKFYNSNTFLETSLFIGGTLELFTWIRVCPLPLLTSLLSSALMSYNILIKYQ